MYLWRETKRFGTADRVAKVDPVRTAVAPAVLALAASRKVFVAKDNMGNEYEQQTR